MPCRSSAWRDGESTPDSAGSAFTRSILCLPHPLSLTRARKDQTVTSGQRSLLGLAAFGLAGLLLGCTRTPPAPPTPPPTPMPTPGTLGGTVGEFDTESGPHAAGKKVLVANGCFRCHAINGVRGPVGGGGAPVPGGAKKGGG